MPYVQVKDIRIHYKQGGNPEGEPVVFINGLNMDTTGWRRVSEALPDYALLRYDCRGQGLSDKPPSPYSVVQHGRDLIGLLDALQIGPCHLVGLSTGGLIGIWAAGTLGASQVRSLSTIDAFVRLDPMLKLILQSWRAALVQGGSKLQFEVATPWVWGYSFLNRHAEALTPFRTQAAKMPPEPLIHYIDGLLDFTDDARKILRAYQGPTLALVGKEDLLTPLRYSHEVVEWAHYGMLATIDAAGHASVFEQPDAVARLLRGFLERGQALLGEL